MMTRPVWTTACTDWEERLRSGRSLLPCGPLYPESAENGLAHFRYFQVTDQPQLEGYDPPQFPTVEDLAGDWIMDLAAAFFGSYDPQSGQRLINQFFLMVPKKNWKSGIAGFFMLAALIDNWRETNRFFVVAPTVEIAHNSFQPVYEAIKADEELSDLLDCKYHERRILHRSTRAELKIVSADTATVGGLKGAGVLIDELYLLSRMAGASEIMREISGGLLARPEGFLMCLSTMDERRPTGVFRSKLNYARGVRDGRITDPTFLPLIYEYSDAMIKRGDHLDKSTWSWVNPNWGRSVDAAKLNTFYGEAQEAGPAEISGFYAKYLNVQPGVGLRTDGWTGAEFWAECGDRQLDLQELIQSSDVVVVTIDGGGQDDLMGIAYLGRHRETRG